MVGILKAATTYNPRLHPEASLNRRNVVLGQMERYDYITKKEKEYLSKLPLQLNYSLRTHNNGLAPYFREYLRKDLTHWCKQTFKPDGSNYNLYTDGLKIYTTIHSRMQQYAESSVASHLASVQKVFNNHWKWRDKYKATGTLFEESMRNSHRFRSLKERGYTDAEIDSIFRVPVEMDIFSWEGPQHVQMSPWDSIIQSEFTLHAGFIAVDPTNGHVRAWVGGINHHFYQFDHVTCLRQTGSVFKPLVYATALEAGESPCQFISNEKTSFAAYNNWTPRNSDNVYGGEYSMEGALTHSVNVVSVNLMMKVGVKNVINLARNLGIENPLPEVPSLALGTGEVSLKDMVGVYSAFANGGRRTIPSYILRIEDQDGQILIENSAVTQPQVMSKNTADMVTYMLKSVVDRGTARGLRTRYGLRNDIAGKTGTSQAQADGWFIGATPDLVAGAWVGADDQRVHFQSLAMGQGSVTALPIVGQFLKQTYQDSDFSYMRKNPFAFPSKDIAAQLDCDEFWFPLSMSEFKEWWNQQQEKEKNEQGNEN
ncbi:MAG: penicillin-binding transpeptidase domain-containing protein [Bacteroidia bacterium]